MVLRTACVIILQVLQLAYVRIFLEFWPLKQNIYWMYNPKLPNMQTVLLPTVSNKQEAEFQFRIWNWNTSYIGSWIGLYFWGLQWDWNRNIIRFGVWSNNIWKVWRFCYKLVTRSDVRVTESNSRCMSEGLSFNLCVAPFLNICVPKLTRGQKSETVGGVQSWVRGVTQGWEKIGVD